MEDVDYVKCKLCGYVARNLKAHVNQKHDLSKEEYQEKHGKTLCTASRKKKQDLKNWNWINRLKESGDPEDMKKYEEWCQKIGPAISKGILASPSARQARRENFAKVGKMDHVRKIASETAKRTSSRPEILQQRTEALARWRERCPDEFYKCTMKMISTRYSEPERQVFEIVSTMFPDFGFVRDQYIKREEFTTKTKIRQIDIFSEAHKIVIEYDGPHHFKPFHGIEKLKKIQEKDSLLNEVLGREGYTVIRVGMDHFEKGSITKECFGQICDIISENKRGVFLIGSSYQETSPVDSDVVTTDLTVDPTSDDQEAE